MALPAVRNGRQGSLIVDLTNLVRSQGQTIPDVEKSRVLLCYLFTYMHRQLLSYTDMLLIRAHCFQTKRAALP